MKKTEPHKHFQAPRQTAPSNLTMRSVIAKNAPDLYAVLEAARAVHNDWMKADARRLEQEVEQRQVELQRKQAQLAAK
jgi:hypothetical protein